MTELVDPQESIENHEVSKVNNDHQHEPAPSNKNTNEGGEGVKKEISFPEQRSRTDPLRTSIRKKTRFIDTEHYKKATIVQARIKGVLLRKKFRLKLKRYVFVKSLINYIRRFNRKVIIKPIFRNLRDKYACYYLLRMLSPKLEGPIRRIKLKMANKIFRSKKIREIIQRQRMKLKVAGWIPLRVKNLTPEQLTDVKSTYATRLINVLSKNCLALPFHNFINQWKSIIEMKKSNFVFNYLAYSFEKGIKYYIVRWKRAVQKIALQEFYLNIDDDEDVVDKVEEKKKVEQLKTNSLIVKKFRYIAYKNMRSKYSKLKDNFEKYREICTRLKIVELKQKKMLKDLIRRQRSSITTESGSTTEPELIKTMETEQIKTNLPDASLYKAQPVVSLSTFHVQEQDYNDIKNVTKAFLATEQNKLLSSESILFEVIKRYSEWKCLKTKSIQVSKLDYDKLYTQSHLPILKFTVEDNQIDYINSVKTNHAHTYCLYQLVKKNIMSYQKKMKFSLNCWKLISNHLKINDSLRTIRNDFTSLNQVTNITENYLTLKFTTIDDEEKEHLHGNQKILPVLNIQYPDEMKRKREMIAEDVDDYYDFNNKVQSKRKEEVKKNMISKALFASKSVRKSRIDIVIEGEDYFDEEEEDDNNLFLKKYKKKIEKKIPNDEEDFDDENRRYIVNFDDFEEEENEKIKNELTFEQKMAMTKKVETKIEFIKEFDDELDLDLEIFDIEMLSQKARQGNNKIHPQVIHENTQNQEVSKHPEANSEHRSEAILDGHLENQKLMEAYGTAENTKNNKLVKIEEDNESDVSVDDLKNLKKSAKKEARHTIFQKEYSYAPKYKEYLKKSSEIIEKKESSKNAQKITSFVKKESKMIS